MIAHSFLSPAYSIKEFTKFILPCLSNSHTVALAKKNLVNVLASFLVNGSFFNLDTIMEENGFSRKNMLTILELIARTQQNVLIEGGLKTEKERGEIKHILRMAGYDVSLVWIQTDIATIRSRLKARFKTVKEAKEFYEKEVATIEAPSDLESPIILSGKHTFETQSKHVLSGLADVN